MRYERVCAWISNLLSPLNNYPFPKYFCLRKWTHGRSSPKFPYEEEFP